MSIETDVVVVLKSVCPRVHPRTAPEGVARPYFTYQRIGGPSLRYVDGTAADKRSALMQVSVWAETAAQADDLIQRAEAALCASPLFVVDPQGESLELPYEPDARLYGCLQRFSIVGSR